MVSVSPSSLTSVVSWCAPGTGIATVSWSLASYTFTGGDSIAACFAITPSLADGCKITARRERPSASAKRRRMASRRPAGPAADGARPAASRPGVWGAGRGARAGRRGGRATTRRATLRRCPPEWFASAVRHPLLWFVSPFCLRPGSPAGRTPGLPRSDLALVESSMDAGACTGHAARADGRGGRLESGPARGAAVWWTGGLVRDAATGHLGLERIDLARGWARPARATRKSHEQHGLLRRLARDCPGRVRHPLPSPDSA